MKKIIITTFLISAIISCGPKPEYILEEYTIINGSTHNVELSVFDAYLYSDIDTTFIMPPGAEVITPNDIFGGGSGGDSAYLVFDNIKQIIYRRDDGNARNILNINNYVGGKVTENLYKYQYNITDEDFANAIEIK